MYQDKRNFEAYSDDIVFLKYVSNLNVNIPTKEYLEKEGSNILEEFESRDFGVLIQIIDKRYGRHLLGRELTTDFEDRPFVIKSATNIVNQARKNIQDFRDYYGIEKKPEEYGHKFYENRLYEMVMEQQPEEKIQDFKALVLYAIDIRYLDLPKRSMDKIKRSLDEAIQRGKRDLEQNKIQEEVAKQEVLF